MLRLKIVLLTAIVTCGHWVLLAQDADAGLLRNWLRRWRQPAATCCPPSLAPTTANYAGLQPGQCVQTCMQTCQRVVVNYVPCTSYRTTYERVPVTTYRPQTTSDPCTGCTVTCMRPCTTYTYRCKRVPYTTYRPVYRTEAYRVPVTTIVNDCNPCCNPCSTGSCPVDVAGCDSCGVGTSVVGQTVPSGTITTDGSYGSQPIIPGATVTPLPNPADTTPGINPQNSNRPVIEGNGGSSTRLQPPPVNWALTSTQPAVKQGHDWSTVPVVDEQSPVTRKWVYSPVKQASYVALDDVEEAPITTIHGSFTPVESDNAAVTTTDDSASVNSGWNTVQW